MKPKVICHVAASVDGHLQVERWSAPYEEDARGEIMGVYPEIAKSFGTDAWTFGRNTVREIFPDQFSQECEGEANLPKREGHDEDSKGNTSLAPVMQPSVYAAERHSDRMFISFDPASDIAYAASQIRSNDILVVLPMQTATASYLSFLQGKGISYMVVEDFEDTKSILEAIHEHFGIQAISLQGGGKLNGGMLNSGVIDELSLVIYPGLDCQKDSVAIFDDANSQAVAKTRLELINAEPKAHGAVWLRYKVHVK